MSATRMPSPRAGKRNNPPKSGRARLLREQPPFTIDSRRALLHDKVLGLRLKRPDDAALGELATYLNFHQRHYIDINESAAHNALRDRAQAALDETAAAFSDCKGAAPSSDQSPRAAVFRYARDQRKGDDQQQGRGDVNPGLDGAGILGAGEDRRGDRDGDDRPDLSGHSP